MHHTADAGTGASARHDSDVPSVLEGNQEISNVGSLLERHFGCHRRTERHLLYGYDYDSKW